MNMNQKLSENFTLREFVISQVAIRLGIDNTPSEKIVQNLKDLCQNVLQPLRNEYGKPIYISSGYRCRVLNRAIGGSDDSDHIFGRAADIDVGEDNILLFAMIYKHLDFDQLIWEFGDETEPAWIHVSWRRQNNRREVLKSLVHMNDGLIYIPYEV